MRLSELLNKRIINIDDGDILGSLGDSDLMINEAGEITSMVLPPQTGLFNSKKNREALTIPRSAIKKIGTEVIVITFEEGTSSTMLP